MMVLKTSLATLMRQYRILPGKNLALDKPIRTKIDVTMKEVEDNEIELEYRKNTQQNG